MSRAGATADPRVQAQREERQVLAARQFRKDVIELLHVPAFRRYMAHVVYGRLELKKSPWRPNAGDTAKAAARAGVAAELLQELGQVDRQGFILLEQEHVNRMAEELELLEPSQEKSDDP